MQEDETCKYLQQDWSDSPPHFAWISVEFTSDSIPGLIGDVIHRLDGAVTWSLAQESCSVLCTLEARIWFYVQTGKRCLLTAEHHNIGVLLLVSVNKRWQSVQNA